VLAQFNYDPHGSANLEAFDLVWGSFSFAFGAIARAGDMRLGTPLGWAKITGSTGDVAFDDGAATIRSFIRLMDRTRRSFPTGTAMRSLRSTEGGKLKLTATGPSQFAANQQTESDADKAFETDALNRILQIKDLADQFKGSSSIGAHGSSFAPLASNDRGAPPYGPNGLSGYITRTPFRRGLARLRSPCCATH